MPFADKEKQKAYMREYMRKARAKSKIGKIEDYWRPREHGWFIPKHAVEDKAIRITVLK